MILNPFYMVLFIYFFSSIFELIFGLSAGGFDIGSDFQVISQQSYFIAFGYQSLTFLFFAYLYIVFQNSSWSLKSFYLSDSWGWFVIFLQVTYVLFFTLTGGRVAGAGSNYNGPVLLNYIFIAIDPDIVALCLLPFIRNRKLFMIGVFIFFVSFSLRGWMGAAFTSLLIYLIRFYPVTMNRKLILKLFVIGASVILAIPILFAFKWGIREGSAFLLIVEAAIRNYSFDLIITGVFRILDRFSNLNNVAFLIEHQEFFHSAYHSGQFRNFWVSGLPFEWLCKITESCGLPLNRYIVAEFYDPLPLPWNVDPGIAGWAVILKESGIFLFFYVCAYFFTFYTFVFRFLGNLSANFFFTFFMVYGFHGWFGKFFNVSLFILFFFIVYFFLKQTFRVKRKI